MTSVEQSKHDCLVYSYGVEIGMLIARMKVETHIYDYYSIYNLDHITQLANRMGWHISEMKSWGTNQVYIDMENRCPHD